MTFAYPALAAGDGVPQHQALQQAMMLQQLELLQQQQQQQQLLQHLQIQQQLKQALPGQIPKASHEHPVESPSDKVFMQGLPQGITEEKLRSIFGAYGTVTFVKVLAPHPAKPDIACLMRMGSLEEAKWLIDNIDKSVPNGLTSPVFIRYANHSAHNSESRPGQVTQTQGQGPPAANQPPSEKLYMKGLPLGSTEEAVAAVFNAYGTVVFCKLLPPPHPNVTDAACLLRMSTLDEAKFLVENLDGNVPAGLSQPVTIRYAASNDRWDAQKSLEMGMQDVLYVKGLPPGVPEGAVKELFAPHGTVVSCKLTLSSAPGTAETIGTLRMGSAEEAQQAQSQLNETLPPGLGLNQPLEIQLARPLGEKGKQVPAPPPPPGGLQRLPPQPSGTPLREQVPRCRPSDSILVMGLPCDITQEVLQMILGAYGGSMLSCRVVASPMTELGLVTCQIRMGSVDECRFLVENLNGQVLLGLQDPVSIRFAETPEAAERSSPYGPVGAPQAVLAAATLPAAPPGPASARSASAPTPPAPPAPSGRGTTPPVPPPPQTSSPETPATGAAAA